MRIFPFFLFGIAALAQTPPIVVKKQGFVPFSDAPIHYRAEVLDDPVTRLEKQLETGEVNLAYEPEHGYLRALLAALRVPVSSQTLVLSKTSFQYPYISPEKPRALYYNDDVYVGQVQQGKLLEFVWFDPMQGAIFYIMDALRVDHPRFERAESDCVQCHVASSTRGIPGVLLRSIFARPSGTQAGRTPAYITCQDSPFKDRWGGWYVTGLLDSHGHMGNGVLGDGACAEQCDHVSHASEEDLDRLVDTSRYLTGSSDVVAHLVLAHRTQMHNLITLMNYQTRIALYKGSGTLSDAALEPIEKTSEQLVRYLLFANEAPIDGTVDRNSSFAADFAARGPRDALGRSVRDFDLKKRIFKYPCSYLIYSDAFDSIPEPARSYIYRRLFEVLSGQDQSPEFASLSAEDRRPILEILVATKPGLPEEWKQFVSRTRSPSQAPNKPASPAKLSTLTAPKGNWRMKSLLKTLLKTLLTAFAVVLGVGIVVVPARGGSIANLDGRWAATIKDGVVIPFRLDVSTVGNKIVGKLYNGEEDSESTTSAGIENGTVQLNFEHYLTRITATLKDGELDGQVTVTRRSAINITPGAPERKAADALSVFHATRYVAPTAEETANAPSIDGVWEIPHDSPKDEKAWRLIVHQKSSEITATILRVDGDAGALTGGWRNGKFVASHFDGARPGLVEITPQQDGSLQVDLRAEPRNAVLTAYRPEVARAKGFPEPASGYRITAPIQLTGWEWSASPAVEHGEAWALDFGDGGRASVVAGDSGLNRALCMREQTGESH